MGVLGMLPFVTRERIVRVPVTAISQLRGLPDGRVEATLVYARRNARGVTVYDEQIRLMWLFNEMLTASADFQVAKSLMQQGEF